MVFAYLTIYLKRSVRVSRWLQIVMVSTVTSMILSRHLGYAVADILVSISVVVPVLGWVFALRRRSLFVLLYVSGGLAAVPISAVGIIFDYSPFLILNQVVLTQIHAEDGIRSAVKHGLCSAAVLMVATGLVSLATTPTASFLVVMFGHPIAALLIAMIQGRSVHQSTPLTRLAKRPLTLYALHLLGFAALAG